VSYHVAYVWRADALPHYVAQVCFTAKTCLFSVDVSNMVALGLALAVIRRS